MATHDRYDNDILKQLTRIANALDRIDNHLSNMPIINSDAKIYDTDKYSKTHPEFIDKINEIAGNLVKERNDYER
mgnify:CR=1 FL=1